MAIFGSHTVLREKVGGDSGHSPWEESHLSALFTISASVRPVKVNRLLLLPRPCKCICDGWNCVPPSLLIPVLKSYTPVM